MNTTDIAIRDLQVRGARIQSLFREVNARLEELKTGSLPSTEIECVCECWEQRCFVPITMTREEYLSLRADPARFVVAPGHFDELIETVVVKRSGYWLIEKTAAGKAIAVSLAPL